MENENTGNQPLNSNNLIYEESLDEGNIDDSNIYEADEDDVDYEGEN